VFKEHFSVDDDNELENKEGKTNEHEAEDLTTSVSDYESFVNIFSALFCGSHVSVDSDSHTDVPRYDGGESTNNEGSGCVECSESWLNCEEE